MYKFINSQNLLFLNLNCTLFLTAPSVMANSRTPSIEGTVFSGMSSLEKDVRLPKQAKGLGSNNLFTLLEYCIIVLDLLVKSHYNKLQSFL